MGKPGFQPRALQATAGPPLCSPIWPLEHSQACTQAGKGAMLPMGWRSREGFPEEEKPIPSPPPQHHPAAIGRHEAPHLGRLKSRKHSPNQPSLWTPVVRAGSQASHGLRARPAITLALATWVEGTHIHPDPSWLALQDAPALTPPLHSLSPTLSHPPPALQQPSAMLKSS